MRGRLALGGPYGGKDGFQESPKLREKCCELGEGDRDMDDVQEVESEPSLILCHAAPRAFAKWSSTDPSELSAL